MMLSVFSLMLLCIAFVQSESEENTYDIEGRAELDWDYEGADKWKDKYPDCGGKNQSPIDLFYRDLDIVSPLRYIDYNIYRRRMVLTNKGYSVELELSEQDKKTPPCIEGGGLDGRYCFKNLHFTFGLNNSVGAEHTINGRRGVAEMHLVHTKEGGNETAVLGVIFVRSPWDNIFIWPITDSLRNVTYKGESTVLRRGLRLSSIVFPTSYLSFFRYKGSMTRPPCTENVSWSIFRLYSTISNRQLNEFRKLMRTEKGAPNSRYMAPNYRPIQKLNGRKVELLFPRIF